MTSQVPLLKTQQVADVLGVSVSTAKRWIDSGALRASRTVGRHRLVEWTEVLAFARRQGLSASMLPPGDDAAGEPVVDDRTRDALAEALASGDSTRAKAIVHAAYAADPDAVSLADDLVRPVMERIGHGWEAGSVEIYQEHHASQSVQAAITELIERLTRARPRGSPLALGATPEGDLYTLSLLLGELLLREAGWDVRNLGPNLPLRSLSRAVVKYRPRLVFLSVNRLDDAERFVEAYRPFHQAASSVDAAVVLGGRALGPDLRPRLIYASFGERMAHLAEFAKRLAPPADVGKGPGGPSGPSHP